MLTVGIDSVDIERFIPFLNYSQKQLMRVFTREEISYCLKEPTKSVERFAARFAAKEAFFKALAPRLEKPLPLLRVCTSCSVLINQKGYPEIKITSLNLKERIETRISITHTTTIATAIVLITNPLVER